MSDAKRCDVCKKYIEDGDDIQQVILSRIGANTGEKMDVCGKCEQDEPKKVILAIALARKRVTGMLIQQARQKAAAEGRVAAYSGNVPPHPGKPQ